MEKSLKLSKDIKMVICDFDGILTDDTFFWEENLNQQKYVHLIDWIQISVRVKTVVINGIL